MKDNDADRFGAEPCPDFEPPEGALVRELKIINRRGLHARATAKLVQCIDAFDAAVTITRCGETVGGTSIMGILTLGAGPGMTITVTAIGAQAAQALAAVEALVGNRFGEEE
ncbi:HPr family phosphocarrier protein [Methylocapsa polymorpha]|uniref:HPr family phosphocarrier protein n=1 Tax=Methylocapsa polymorpha TaxID=3080828 RepID=A0ABZ0HU20_9HYPH|nr:HPr family phosphocarrier protein [Methylocapsa sp. RX1]